MANARTCALRKDSIMLRTTALTLTLLCAVPVCARAADPAKDPAPAAVPAWTVDRPLQRPAALPALYASYVGLQAMDLYTTRKALAAGATESNPMMRSGNTGAAIAIKAATGAATIYFAERAWKKNRVGAIVLMAALNGVTAAVVARNAHNARR
jgi:hypothetical protein